LLDEGSDAMTTDVPSTNVRLRSVDRTQLLVRAGTGDITALWQALPWTAADGTPVRRWMIAEWPDNVALSTAGPTDIPDLSHAGEGLIRVFDPTADLTLRVGGGTTSWLLLADPAVAAQLGPALNDTEDYWAEEAQRLHVPDGEPFTLWTPPVQYLRLWGRWDQHRVLQERRIARRMHSLRKELKREGAAMGDTNLANGYPARIAVRRYYAGGEMRLLRYLDLEADQTDEPPPAR
jgi:hypothetical protein